MFRILKQKSSSFLENPFAVYILPWRNCGLHTLTLVVLFLFSGESRRGGAYLLPYSWCCAIVHSPPLLYFLNHLLFHSLCSVFSLFSGKVKLAFIFWRLSYLHSLLYIQKDHLLEKIIGKYEACYRHRKHVYSVKSYPGSFITIGVI